MTRLDEAQEKLTTALARLEAAMRGRSSMAGELAQTKARHDSLLREARAVSERLERTTERVRGLLGR